MNVLVTGGAGFIGRWVVQRLLATTDSPVVVVDDFSNSRPANLAEFQGHPRLTVVHGDISCEQTLPQLWQNHGPFATVYHLAAKVRVQDSIDQPVPTFHSDVTGTLNLLECCRRQFFESNQLAWGEPFHLLACESRLTQRTPRLVFMSTCMVYAPATAERGIAENHPLRPASPYAACKIAAENLVLSYHHAYRMPTKVIRPFNTYGPFQKRNMEGGVVAIFISRDLSGQPLLVKGDGSQTRDLLYVEDCARFVVAAGQTRAGDGDVLNAGLGRDIAIRELAEAVRDQQNGGHGVPIAFIEHDHPQAEIPRLLCDARRAEQVLNWRPEVSLAEGLRRTRAWIAAHPEAL